MLICVTDDNKTEMGDNFYIDEEDISNIDNDKMILMKVTICVGLKAQFLFVCFFV